VSAIADIQHVEELNIGHAIIARAALTGLQAAVRDMLALI
jgi:pyridoxine 5-phosphate synthase